MQTKAPVISVTDLSHSFGEGLLKKEVLHQVSVDFYPGEIIIITGPSGSGKTTFLTLAGALRSVQTGDLLVNGQNLRNLCGADLIRIRQRIGFIFQAHNLINSLTACQNVEMALIGDSRETPESAQQKALKYLAEVGLKEFADKKPNQLSGGQKQRVAIARALVRRPEIILADEPTASLDKKTGREVVTLLHRLAKRSGSAILLVTHDNRILDVADRIIHIEDGCLEETQISMERIMGHICQLLDLLARYPACWRAEGGDKKPVQEELRAEFIHTVGPLNRQVTDLSQGEMPEKLARHTKSLQEMLSHTALLEETVSALGELLFSESDQIDTTLADQLLQSTEFLLLTAAETLRTTTPDGIEMLKRLTHDRGELMGKLRDRYFAPQHGLGEEAMNTLFAATQAFTRQVYFLRHVTTNYFSLLKFLET